jgi:hypothetical protein
MPLLQMHIGETRIDSAMRPSLLTVENKLKPSESQNTSNHNDNLSENPEFYNSNVQSRKSKKRPDAVLRTGIQYFELA